MADESRQFHSQQSTRTASVVRFLGGGAITLGASLSLLYSGGLLIASIVGGYYVLELFSRGLDFLGFGIFTIHIVGIASLLTLASGLIGLASNAQPLAIGFM